MKSDELKPSKNLQKEIESLQQELKSLQQELKEHQDKGKDLEVRHAAELANNRQRFAKQLEQAGKYSCEKFAQAILPTLDALVIAQKTMSDTTAPELAKGIDMALQIFMKSLADNGIKPIPTENQEFNPELHMAVKTQESKEHKSNHIIETLQAGYTIHDRVLRHATVIVAT